MDNLIYSKILSEIDQTNDLYPEVLERRGMAYERTDKWNLGEKDLIESLRVKPKEPYVMNYLAYSWLERKIKINQSMEMLLNAYHQRSDDPYIIDSVGWAYYLTKDYLMAEKYLKNALLIMPDDPIVNDHYGDVLWKLNMKLQASYYWKVAASSDEADEQLKEIINDKLIFGLNKLQ